MIDYNIVLKKPWIDMGISIIYKTNCLQIPPEGNGIWNLALPPANIRDDEIILLHCQDFLNYNGSDCRELMMMQNHYGDRSKRVVAVTWEINMHERYSGSINLAYFPTHTYNIIIHLRECQDLWRPRLTGSRTRRFQCLNGIARPHRALVVSLLDQLHVPNYTSLGPERQLPVWPYYPNYFNCENEHNYIKLLYVYGDADINVVTETVYEERPGIITEKTLFALMSLQVPLLIGYAGMVQHVKNLGFDVFDDVVDISYDWLPNEIRIQEAMRRNEHLFRQGINRDDLSQRLQANQDRVLAWPEKMIKDYQQRCADIQDDLARP